MSKLKEILAQEGLVMPGVYDALSAKIAERAGFDVIFTPDTASPQLSWGSPTSGS